MCVGVCVYLDRVICFCPVAGKILLLTKQCLNRGVVWCALVLGVFSPCSYKEMKHSKEGRLEHTLPSVPPTFPD